MIEVTRRLLLSGVLVVFGTGSVLQVVAACLICLLSTRVFAFYSAFEDSDDDILAEVAQWQLFGVLFIGLLIRFNELTLVTGEDGVIDNAYALGLLLTTVVLASLARTGFTL